MSDSSAGQGYPSQDDGLTAYPDESAARGPVNPVVPVAYSQAPSQAVPQPPYGPVPGALGSPPPYGPTPQPYGPSAPYPVPTGPYPPVDAAPRVVPQSVQIAFYVMLAGAVVTLLAMAYSLTMLDEARSNALDASGGVLRGDDLDLLVYATIGGSIASSLVTAGLWVWMAFVCRAGKNWGRITGTVFFGLNALFYVVGTVMVMVTSTAGIALVFSTVTLAVGLAAVILLWNGMSGPYFAPRTPPGYQPYPGYPPVAP
ncbi:hypothetical protein [Nocardia salmonicida]|uniref:hypothetical protein n=1 Tax=Nocardia salmonicida TaxID=53431 RepID=UPI000A6E98C7|nr:hypothetical protein [Nocardia salmonicida]